MLRNIIARPIFSHIYQEEKSRTSLKAHKTQNKVLIMKWHALSPPFTGLKGKQAISIAFLAIHRRSDRPFQRENWIAPVNFTIPSVNQSDREPSVKIQIVIDLASNVWLGLLENRIIGPWKLLSKHFHIVNILLQAQNKDAKKLSLLEEDSSREMTFGSNAKGDRAQNKSCFHEAYFFFEKCDFQSFYAGFLSRILGIGGSETGPLPWFQLDVN